MTGVAPRTPELTLPVSDVRALRRHLGGALSRLASDLARVPVPADPVVGADVRDMLARLAPLARREPGLVFSGLRRPSVYVHLRLAADGAPDVAGLLRTGLATLAVELACAGGLSEPLVVRRPPSRLLVRSRGVALALSEGEPLHVAPDGTLRQSGRVCSGVAAHLPVSDAIALALADDNPLASFEAHPDKTGSHLDLGEAPAEAWVAALRDALDRIAAHLPVVREELELLVSQVVPVGTHAERHLSASYREALGTLYVSLHPDPMTMTEAVLHEAQHNKLNAVLTVDPLLENDPAERYASPVRPDPRPLLGVLLAVHAFVPVAVLYGAMRASGGLSERDQARAASILRGNGDGLALLRAQARPTRLGAELLDELTTLHAASVAALDGPELGEPDGLEPG